MPNLDEPDGPGLSIWEDIDRTWHGEARHYGGMQVPEATQRYACLGELVAKELPMRDQSGREIRKPRYVPPHTPVPGGAKWTPEMTEMLLELYRCNTPLGIIATRTGRTREACKKRYAYVKAHGY